MTTRFRARLSAAEEKLGAVCDILSGSTSLRAILQMALRRYYARTDETCRSRIVSWRLYRPPKASRWLHRWSISPIS